MFGIDVGSKLCFLASRACQVVLDWKRCSLSESVGGQCSPGQVVMREGAAQEGAVHTHGLVQTLKETFCGREDLGNLRERKKRALSLWPGLRKTGCIQHGGQAAGAGLLGDTEGQAAVISGGPVLTWMSQVSSPSS